MYLLKPKQINYRNCAFEKYSNYSTAPWQGLEVHFVGLHLIARTIAESPSAVQTDFCGKYTSYSEILRVELIASTASFLWGDRLQQAKHSSTPEDDETDSFGGSPSTIKGRRFGESIPETRHRAAAKLWHLDGRGGGWLAGPSNSGRLPWASARAMTNWKVCIDWWMVTGWLMDDSDWMRLDPTLKTATFSVQNWWCATSRGVLCQKQIFTRSSSQWLEIGGVDLIHLQIGIMSQANLSNWEH